MIILQYALYILIPIAFILLIWGIVEPRILHVQKDKIEVQGNKDIDLKIVYLSDLHGEQCFIPVDKVTKIIKEEYSSSGVDLVIFGGDICNNPKKYQIGANYLNKIAITCNQLNIPFIGTNGNHDIMLTEGEIDSCGFNNISDKNYIFRKENQTIRFSGLSDSGRHNRVWKNIPQTNEQYDLHITLSHNPDQILHLEGEKPDIMLSGHIHGGQIRTPFKIEFTVLRKDELPHQGVYYGLHEINDTKVYISKGIGCVSMPFRLAAQPEINLIHIKTNRS